MNDPIVVVYENEHLSPKTNSKAEKDEILASDYKGSINV